MKRRSSFILKGLVGLAILILVLGATAEFWLPHLIDIGALKTTIQDTIRKSTNIRLAIEELSIRPTLTDGIEVTFRNNVLQDPESIRIAEAGRIIVHIRYLPLVFKGGRKEISKLEIHNPRVFIGENSFFFRIKTPPEDPNADVQMVDTELRFSDYTIEVDRYFDGVNRFRLTGDKLALKHLRSDRPFTLDGEGKVDFIQHQKLRPLGRFDLYSEVAKEAVTEKRLDMRYLLSSSLTLRDVRFPTLATWVSSYKLPVQGWGDISELSVQTRRVMESGKFSGQQLFMRAETKTSSRLEGLGYRFRLEPGQVRFNTRLLPAPDQQITLEKMRLLVQSPSLRWEVLGDIQLRKAWERAKLNLQVVTNRFSVASLGFLPNAMPLGRIFREARGDAKLDARIRGDLAAPQLRGALEIFDVSLPGRALGSPSDVRRVSGRVLMDDNLVALENLTGRFDENPFLLNLRYRLKNQLLSGRVQADPLRLESALATLRGTMRTFNQPLPPLLSQLTLRGLAHVDLQLADVRLGGTSPATSNLSGRLGLENVSLLALKSPGNPILEGLRGNVFLANQEIRFPDLRMNLDGQPLRLSGLYFLRPEFLDASVFGSNLDVAALETSARRLASALGEAPPELEAVDLKGRTNLALRLRGAPDAVAARPLEHLTGTVSLQGGSLRHKPRNLLLTGIQGNVALGEMIAVTGGRAYLGTSLFHLDGTASRDFSRYRMNLRGNRVNLEAFRREVLANLPEMRESLRQISSLSGIADVNLVASRQAGPPVLKGNVSVDSLALRTPDLPYPLKIGRLLLDVSGAIAQNGALSPTIIVPKTTGSLGPIAFITQGRVAPGGGGRMNYDLSLETGEVPLDLVRVQRATLSRLLGHSLPELWNTSGGVVVSARLRPADVRGKLVFKDAGASWEGANFPLYNLNGTVAFTGKPTLDSDRLTFHYGNSPVTAELHYHGPGSLSLISEGVLSPLLVNHILTSPGSVLNSDVSAGPARREVSLYAQVPYSLNVGGALASLSPGGRGNNLRAELNLDFNRVLPRPEVPTTPSSPDVTSPESPETAPAAPSPTVNIPNVGNGNGGETIVKAPLQTKVLALVAANPGPVSPETRMDTPIPALPSALSPAERDPVPAPTTPAPPRFDAVPSRREEDDVMVTPEAPLSLRAVVNLRNDRLSVDEGVFTILDSGSLVLQGAVERLFTPGQENATLRVATVPSLDFSKLAQLFPGQYFQGTTGTLTTDLTWATPKDEDVPEPSRPAETSDVAEPPVSPSTSNGGSQGFIRIENVSIPPLDLLNLSGVMTLEGRRGLFDISRFHIPGVDVGLRAHTEDLAILPWYLEDVEISGRQFVVTQFTDFVKNIVTERIQKGMIQQVVRPWRVGPGTLPIEFRNARVSLDEVVFNNIIMDAVTSDLSLYANSYFELNNTKLTAAGGGVTANVSMNPSENNFLTADLVLDHVKANALARALMNLPNQIFGDMTGSLRFTTQGMTDIEMLDNVNGTASFNIRNGRLPAVARVETLLSAANILRGGLVGLNLNTLFRALAPFETNYFARLSGDAQIAQGVAYTDNLLSDGQNLDLLIEGSVRLKDGLANLRVNGTMSRDVSGLLGPLGKLSIGRLVEFIPGIGYLPGTSRETSRGGLLSYIPGVGFIPGFGGPSGRFNRFSVRMAGPMDDPGSVQDLQWLP